jgi:uncharacterized SAM-binding protein YcdF (DUF218 family)
MPNALLPVEGEDRVIHSDVVETPPTAGRASAFAGCAEGIVLGTLIGMILCQFGLATFRGYIVLLSAGLCAIACLTRARLLVLITAGFLTMIYLLVAFVPVTGFLMQGLKRQDALKPCPAVVVLGSNAFKDQTLGSDEQERLIKAYEILRQGWAASIVLTRPCPPATPWDGAVRREMEELKLDYPVDVVGPVRDTHDEAVATARLARERGWDTIILVTQPWHMRRAAAAFEKAGLRVFCAPCSEGNYDATNLDGPGDRIAGFHDWLHEETGYLYYRVRGWV